MSDADDWLPLCSSGDFPKLISYHGDVHILPFVLSGSKLRVIYISVSADDDIEVVFETLHTVRESLRCFSMFMEFWDVQCIDIISKHIPDLQVLRLMCHLREDGADHSQALVSLRAYTRLVHNELTVLHLVGRGLSIAQVHRSPRTGNRICIPVHIQRISRQSPACRRLRAGATLGPIVSVTL